MNQNFNLSKKLIKNKTMNIINNRKHICHMMMIGWLSVSSSIIGSVHFRHGEA